MSPTNLSMLASMVQFACKASTENESLVHQISALQSALTEQREKNINLEKVRGVTQVVGQPLFFARTYFVTNISYH
jgi:hypothetical protein